MTTPSAKPTPTLPLVFNLTVLAAYFHAGMEWLFFVTQSSSLSTLSLFEKAKVLFATGGVLALVLLALVLVLALPAQKWKALGYLPAAGMLALTLLVLLDNFSYTVFKFGIVTTAGAWRAIYAVGFIFLLYGTFRFIRRQRLWQGASFLTLGLLAVSTTALLSVYASLAPYVGGFNVLPLAPSAESPNIIIIGGDGLSAAYLSAYGYPEETTPFLKEMIKTSLVAENAFPNASSTTASTTTVLTGKEPAEVKVYRYPDILAKEDSFEHLPGILKHKGYQTVEIGTNFYVDAKKLNLLDGFEVVNNAAFDDPLLDLLQPLLGNSPSAYFIQTVAERADERLSHIFFIKEMNNPFEQVNYPNARLTDSERMQDIIHVLESADRPVFIFSHFMNTHGPHFSSEGKSASEGSSGEEKEWDAEMYKEAIRTFDAHLQELYSYLEESGRLDNTILVIYTDHGYRYVVNQRIPLIMHFPNDAHAGRIQNNVQIIDIAPTLLDYLETDQPAWMTGASLLQGEPPAERQIISITAGSPKKIKPPFYQIKSIQVLVCQKWYALNVQENAWKTGEVKAHTAPCDPALLPPEDLMRLKILDYLQNYGYDISSLK